MFCAADSHSLFLVLLRLIFWASLIAQLEKNLPAMQDTLVQFLGKENPLEKGRATHSSILGLSLEAQLVKNPPAMKKILV